MTAILSFILKSKFAQGAIALTLVLIAVTIAISSYGSNRDAEGYARALQDSTGVWAERYSDLENARTLADTSTQVFTLPSKPIRYQGRDNAKRLREDSIRITEAFQRGWSQGMAKLQDEYTEMSYAAIKEIDTMQAVVLPTASGDTTLFLPVRGVAMYDPPTRWWDISLDLPPIVFSLVLVKTGYILDRRTTVEKLWSLELLLGSSVKSPALRISPSVWHDSWGAGIDFENKRPPVFKVGGRLQW